MLFARQMPPQRMLVDLKHVIEEGLGFLESRCAKNNVVLKRRLSQRVPPIPADPAQLNQVLVNLVVIAIHYSSQRATASFLPVNCGGTPETLLESELFGYVKGSFTGALESRAGFFQTADGGTIFLDEISETSLNMQVKLLRVLQDKQVHMIGSNRPRHVDVRILASTNKDLLALIQAGLFREDLYYRLNVVSIALPPLRERGDDVLLLIRHFAAKFSKELGRPVPYFTDEALHALKNGYHWPGNVRELENVVQSLMVMVESDTINVSDLPAMMRFSPPRQHDVNRTLAQVEAEHVRHVLAMVDGNKTKAARILGIDRKTLREKLKGLEKPPHAEPASPG